MASFTAWSVAGLPEIHAGDDLAGLIAGACLADPRALRDDDVVVVASKVVAKAEGRLRRADDREEAIDSETVRVVASRAGEHGVTRIVQTRHGFVMAAAGVDASNVPAGHVLLLPEDPDRSALELARELRRRCGAHVGVVVTDTFGRPWREAQTDLAVGAAHVRVIEDHRGGTDVHGRPLVVSAAAVADEIASAADLVKGKDRSTPVAVVRGLDVVTAEPGPGVSALIRDPSRDLFRWGAQEAYRLGAAGEALT